MEINIKNFTFKIKENIKIGRKNFNINNIEKKDVELTNKKN